jgi:hypothetical protein
MTVSFRAWVGREYGRSHSPMADLAADIVNDEYWPDGPGSLGRYEHRLRECGAQDHFIEMLRQAWEAYTIAVRDPRSPFAPVGTEALKAVLRERPALNDGGYGQPDGVIPTTDPPCLDSVRAAARWIRTCVWTKPDIYTSYTLKHVMEREAGVYVTNGAFIAAALAVDCPVRLGAYNPAVGIRLWRPDRRPGHPGNQPHWSVKEWGRNEPGRPVGVDAESYAAGENPIFLKD